MDKADLIFSFSQRENRSRGSSKQYKHRNGKSNAGIRRILWFIRVIRFSLVARFIRIVRLLRPVPCRLWNR